jgi:hypothetical protein
VAKHGSNVFRGGTFSPHAIQVGTQRQQKDLSRKDAKAQSAAAFLNGFLCAFAPLREKCFYRAQCLLKLTTQQMNFR